MLDIKNKSVLVLGLGASGYAAAKLLAAKGAHVKISEAFDGDGITSRMNALACLSVEHETGGHTEAFCSDAEMIVASPGVDAAALRASGILRKEVPIIGELELGALYCRAPIIAVTGTNGKSTTTELIGSMLSLSGRDAVTCGNIGNPLSGEWERLAEDSIAVVEVSSFQLETVRAFKPHIAALLNISEDHYERHGSYDRYRAEKFRIFANQSPEDWAVLHSDLSGDPFSKKLKGRLVFFDGKQGDWKNMVKEDEIFLKGAHNLDNIACAVLVSRIIGLDDRHITEAIRSFRGLAHRFEKVCDIDGVEFIDDSKATNVAATRRALESIEKKVVLIAGGRDKGGDYLSILPALREKVKTIVLIGEAAVMIKDALSSAVPTIIAENMEDAVKKASDVASEGEAVLLSPMCSSFDMFVDYKDRGEAFRRGARQICRLTDPGGGRP